MPSPLWIGDNVLIEQPGSPEWTFEERVTLRRVWRGPHALSLSSAPLKGSLGTGMAAGMVVSKSRVQRERGAVGVLTVEYANSGTPTQGATLPPSEASVDTQQLDTALRFHPRYSSLSDDLKEKIKTLVETADTSTQSTALAAVNANSLAKELYTKLRDGRTHYALWNPVYKLRVYSWIPPVGATVGGFRQAPPGVPITAPAGYEWIRQGDQVAFNGSQWVVESSWLAAPKWDADLYPTG